MSVVRRPSFEPRRRKDLRAELIDRARLWLPEWRPRHGAADFATAVFEIAARLESEVTQRLDKVPEKSFRGFLHWLGVRGEPSRAARLPVVFNMTAGSPPVDAEALVQLQAIGTDDPVTFETEQPLRILPGQLVSIVAADPTHDAFYLPPPGLFAVVPPPAVPDEWTLKVAADAGATQLQLEPTLGLDEGMTLVELIGSQRYRVTEAREGIVTIDPPLGTIEGPAGSLPTMGAGLLEGARLKRLVAFEAFGGAERNRQEHALYIGSQGGFNVEIAAIIEIVGGGMIPSDAHWSFWGKASPEKPPEWRVIEKTVSENGQLFLEKPAGGIEIKEVDGHKSRWLRATRDAGFPMSNEISDLQLRINCPPEEVEKGSKDRWPKARPVFSDASNVAAKERLTLEGIANTAPLVLGTPFYPLGREPRLFDAFYLGSKEAFSKPGAQVTLDFKVDDGFSSPLAAVAFASLPPKHLVFAIGSDHKLRRLSQTVRTDGGGPSPMIEFLDATQPPGEHSSFLSLAPDIRPGAAMYGNAAYATALAADDAIWRWTQASQEGGGWVTLGTPQTIEPGPEDLKELHADSVLVVKKKDDSRGPRGLYAYTLRNGFLFRRNAIPPPDATPSITDWEQIKVGAVLSRIVPVVRVDALAGDLAEEDGLVGVTTKGHLIDLTSFIPVDGLKPIIPVEWTSDQLDTTVYPLVLKDGDRVLCVARKPDRKLIALDSQQPEKGHLAAAALVGHAFSFSWDPVPRQKTLNVSIVLATTTGDIKYPTLWYPFDGEAPLLGDASLDLTEAPVKLDEYLLFPGERGDAHVTSIVRSSPTVAAITDAAVITGAPDLTAENILFLDFPIPPKSKTSDRNIHLVEKQLRLGAGKLALELNEPVEQGSGAISVDLYLGLHPNGGFHDNLPKGTLNAESTKLTLEGDDAKKVTEGGFLLVRKKDNSARIVKVLKLTGNDAELEEPLWVKVTNVDYQSIERIGSFDVTVRPSVDITGLTNPAILVGTVLYFEDLDPSIQVPLYVLQDRVLLAAAWESPPTSPAMFIVLGPFLRFASFVAGRPRNPELSWEYWDGAGWWQIPDLEDRTGNLTRSKEIVFCVPDNLQPTDVVGHTNHWIRARLVGGDYGQESVTTTSTDMGKGVMVYSVERSREKIHPPYVLTLEVTYQVCCPIRPDVILAVDSRTVRDQTDAARASGAVIEYFVPLAETLSRLAGSTSASKDSAANPPARASECFDCATAEPWPPIGQNAGTAGTPPSPALTGDRALYLCFDTELTGGPIRILFLVEREGEHEGAFPLQVEALIGGHFKSIVARDDTRGLNESGVVELFLAESPQLTRLFGQEGYWLRLRPWSKPASWLPSIRGAYLNASWATASESQSLEFLGSSDGSPKQHVTLTRTPVLAKSLELRVREPLGDEDVAALNCAAAGAVATDVGKRPGRWVLWREVIDPADSGPSDRVYAFNNTTGEVTFGDGAHGMIPPIGRDAIVAVRYKRGGGAAANKVSAWSQINLVTPLQGVEGAVAIDGAAGGSDPQDPATTIRFAPAQLNRRDRALTLRDFESLALESAPDIAQARAVATPAGVRLVIVMRGRDPLPSKAVQRELTRFLTGRGSPDLCTPGVLQIVPPKPMPIHLDLRLQIDGVDNSGTVAKAVVTQIEKLLDPATGGHDGAGWRLGDVPSDTDIAATLVDIEHLESIESIAVQGLDAHGKPTDIVDPLRSDQLVQLLPDGVRIEFANPALEVA